MRRASAALVLAGPAAFVACNAILGAGAPNAVDASAGDASADGGDGTADVTPSDAGFGPEADVAADAVTCNANLKTDAHNCGRCTHDCLGGFCISGVCEPTRVYLAPDTPSSIAVAGSTIYVTAALPDGPTSGHVFGCSVSNCAGTKTELATGLRQPIFAKLLGSTLFWTNSGTTDDAGVTLLAPGNVASCPTTGCSDAGPTIYGGDGGLLEGLAVDPTFVYWADSWLGEVDECTTASCNVTTLAMGGAKGPFDLAITPSYLYWTDLSLEEVLRCTLPSCSQNPELFASGQQAAWGIAVHGGNVYWTLSDPMLGAVMWCPESGCGGKPKVLAPNQVAPYFIAADDSGVYWTSAGDGRVWACPGGASCAQPIQVALAPGPPEAIALDDVSIYYTTAVVGGAVWRVAKP
jgi:hypothetical protein